MVRRHQMKKIIKIISDIIEIYVPSVMMVLLFVAFILQIVSRYIFRHPLVWPYEFSQMAYLWVITLGCLYAQRTDDNIVFSIVYDVVPDKVKAIFRILSDLLITVVFAAVLPSVISFYQFYFTRYSTVFKFPMGLVYLGFLFLMIITMLRSIRNIIKNVRELFGRNKGEVN